MSYHLLLHQPHLILPSISIFNSQFTHSHQEMENSLGNHETEMNLKATELRLGLPGCDEVEKLPCNFSILRKNKRSSPEASDVESMSKSKLITSNGSSITTIDDQDNAPPSK